MRGLTASTVTITGEGGSGGGNLLARPGAGSEAMVLVYPVLVLLGAIVAERIVRWILRARCQRIQPQRHVWGHALLAALERPLRAGIGLVAVALILHHFMADGRFPLFGQIFPATLGVITTLLVTWFLLGFVHHSRHNYTARAIDRGDEVDRTLLDAVGKLLWIVILSIAVLSVLQTLGLSITGLLAFGGAAGIAVGFAAQNLVANLLGGLTIIASDIFKIGESIILPGTDLRGDVQAIGWRATRVLGWDGRPFYIPNAMFNTNTVINHSRMAHRTISEQIHLRWRDLEKARTIIERGNQLLAQRSDINYYVFRFDSFGASTVQLKLYAWALTPAYADFMRVKEEILLAIADIARAAGCELILPESNLYWREADVGKPAPPGRAELGAERPGAARS